MILADTLIIDIGNSAIIRRHVAVMWIAQENKRS